MRIPQIRARLFEKSVEHSDPELADLAIATRRRPCPFPRSPARARHLSPEEQAAVRLMKRLNPGMSYHELAIRFGTNIGRISEALNGVRE
jgi:hypothetical protein